MDLHTLKFVHMCITGTLYTVFHLRAFYSTRFLFYTLSATEYSIPLQTRGLGEVSKSCKKWQIQDTTKKISTLKNV